MVKIFIDPGHGGQDPGATANGLQEKSLCLTIALKLRDILQRDYMGHQLKLSRTHDQTLSLRERTDMANRWGADYVVSIHINAGGGTGFESYIYNGTYKNKLKTDQLRAVIHEKIVKMSEFTDRGKKEANFHMLRESLMPAILTENGFIDNTKDAKRLRDMDFLARIAAAHARGLARALGLSQTQGMLPEEPTPVDMDGNIHIVERGDTLWSLAKRYDTTVEKLKAWNPSVVPKRLQIGEQLVVRSDGGTGKYHTIEKGDTLWQLGIKYGTTVVQLLELNPGLDPQRLRIGERVRVRS